MAGSTLDQKTPQQTKGDNVQKNREKKNASENQQQTFPVFLNRDSGSAEQALATLQNDTRITLNCLPPIEMKRAIDHQVENNSPRIAVCGGDGTLSLAATRLVGSSTELAILPGGTLNHFSSRLGIPSDFSAALELALTGQAKPVAAGYVNDHLFLNTSSVGAYVQFVRTREQLEKRMGYSSASFLAGLRRLLRFRSAKINLNGLPVRSPLVFIGVHERDLQFPALGQKKSEGLEGLHIIVIRDCSRLESLKIASKAILWGIDPLEQAEEVENFVRHDLELNYRGKRRKLTVALDGELTTINAPLRYSYMPQAFHVVVPTP